MYVRCMLTMQDLNDPQSNPLPLLSCVRTTCDASDYYLCVWNSLYPHDAYFDLAMLSKINHEFVAEGKLGLEFKEPKQLLSIDTQYMLLLNLLCYQIKEIIKGKKVNVETRRIPKLVFSTKAVMNHFDPLAVEFVSVDRFDNRLLNMRNLTTLTMKNCDLPTIPVEIGHLPIEYLDITGSKLPINQDTFWDWMSMTVICGTLTTLKINSIGLTRLPFEIMYLKSLETLFATNNKLTYLPEIICEVKNLKSLFVADNNFTG
ncbi:leucine-rich repeat-containing protein 69-like isoform X2 [Rhopalosiphum padi]|uniref:leucine-rich repeat-containing protein 69-like isoform X2 n=1 Tax=Rhopalosiphum padi TaxID=40932 RepID=UPI00298E1EFB|nr:leucine-rich repeat-containing protein 69-like isoform X2 [Rhopalosiphum padi]